MNPLNAVREFRYLVESTASPSSLFSVTDLSTFISSAFTAYYQNAKLSDGTNVPAAVGISNVEYSTTAIEKNSLSTQSSYAFQENAESYRYLRLQKPVFQYNFKVGNYFPDSFRKMNLHLFTTINDVTTGIRKAP